MINISKNMENSIDSTPRNPIYPTNKINYLLKYIKASAGAQLLKTRLLNSLLMNQVSYTMSGGESVFV